MPIQFSAEGAIELGREVLAGIPRNRDEGRSFALDDGDDGEEFPGFP